MLLADVYAIPVYASLAVIVLTLAAAVLGSLLHPKAERPAESRKGTTHTIASEGSG
jgi:hypothetical protein